MFGNIRKYIFIFFYFLKCIWSTYVYVCVCVRFKMCACDPTLNSLLITESAILFCIYIIIL